MTAQPETRAPAWSVRLSFELIANDQTAQAVAAGLTNEQLNWQPAPGSWSVGQCLEHLCITNEAYLASIYAALKGSSDCSVEQIALGWFARWFIRRFVEPSPNSKRVSALPKIRPAAHVDLTVLDRFLSENRSCRELFVRTRGKDVNRIRFWNPIVPGVRFTVGTGFEIIAGHERRHLLQAERVRDSAKFPAG
jgi:hypothetical protein